MQGEAMLRAAVVPEEQVAPVPEAEEVLEHGRLTVEGGVAAAVPVATTRGVQPVLVELAHWVQGGPAVGWVPAIPRVPAEGGLR